MREERGFLQRKSQDGIDRFGGFLLLTAFMHRSLGRRAGHVLPLVC